MNVFVRATLVIALFVCHLATAQTTAPADTATKIYTIVEQMPVYPGGLEAINSLFKQNFNYPKEALKQNIEGKVYISFIVDTTGQVTKAEVKRGIGGGCDEEALRLVNMLERFTPAKQNGINKTFKYTMPISFYLEKIEKEKNEKSFLYYLPIFGAILGALIAVNLLQ